jgi:hypothetical protein
MKKPGHTAGLLFHAMGQSRMGGRVSDRGVSLAPDVNRWQFTSL